ncbi:MAG: hypothetical protein LBU14_00960 [Candidatus Peribacteria bacterium]|nr:hypothetical protein [Candidatus Peribacteria bacterium]
MCLYSYIIHCPAHQVEYNSSKDFIGLSDFLDQIATFLTVFGIGNKLSNSTESHFIHNISPKSFHLKPPPDK